jgi:hypothetical protein
VGEKSITDEVATYCREIEVYLCRKNDGHLIRVVGPSFECVSGWAKRGVPLKIALEGIDRYFERYYRSGPRRRPVKIDFCEADVLDAFDEWRRATGITTTGSPAPDASAEPRRPSLPAHLERVVMRLSSARATGALPPDVEQLIDRLSEELDRVRAKAGGLRGQARQEVVERLAHMDAVLLDLMRAQLDSSSRDALVAEADEELRPFRAGMAPSAYDRARDAAVGRLIRQKFALPTLIFD